MMIMTTLDDYTWWLYLILDDIAKLVSFTWWHGRRPADTQWKTVSRIKLRGGILRIERWHTQRKSKNQLARKRELKLNLAEREKSMWHPWHYLKGHLVQRCSIYDLTLNTLVRTWAPASTSIEVGVHITQIQGDFFTGSPPKSSKYKQVRYR